MASVGRPVGGVGIRAGVPAGAAAPALAGAHLAERLLGAGAKEILERAEEMA